MIQLPSNIAPSQDALNKLGEYQGTIDQLATFAEKSSKAKEIFSSRNKIGNPVFDQIKIKLTEMCSGARRCVYCEDSVADEVEHIRPKNLYPESCFTWENYVYACGACNGPKNDKFAVFRNSDGVFAEVNPPKGTPAVQPPQGEDALINPRTEDPMNYCMLDLTGTFMFVIIPEEGTKEHKRADYTFNTVLRLNEQREYLRKARENAFGNYKARLFEYVKQKQQGVPQEKLEKMISGIKSESHPTVWKEMQRQYRKGILKKFDADLAALFDGAPEALGW
jgi:uncharacterized protein (TIGR02646 family)